MVQKRLSVITPVYNEAGNIAEFYRRLTAVLNPLPMEWEIIFVDDGSRDSTLNQVKILGLEDPRVRYISLSRNFGHQQALTAGFDFATGDGIVTMDGDLQHPPELIPALIKEWLAGYEIIYTKRVATNNIGLYKRFSAWCYYKIINLGLPFRIEPNTSDFRLMDRKVVDVIKSLQEQARFYRGLVGWIGFKQKCIEYEASDRFAGNTKYTLMKMLRLASYGILSYSYLPLWAVIYCCFFFILASGGYAGFVLYQKFISLNAVPGQASILLTILIATTVQMFAFSILALYTIKIFQEVRHRPIYVVREQKGFTENVRAKEISY